MTRSLYVLGAAALAYTGTAVAAEEKTYQLADSFNYKNFFDNFDFFESNYDTGNYNDVDPTSGYVNYRSRADAEELGLVATQGTEMYIGVDHANTLDVNGKGRSSVRLESKKSFESGLIIAKFSHLPAPVCGSWPGYWMYGSNWPSNGEIDIYENWNNAPNNLISLHTDKASDVGTCKLVQSEMTDPIVTPNCDNNALGQYTNQGCGATEVGGLWGSASGGVYATEWTDDAISIWSWPWGSVPSDIDANPDPTKWGTPRFRVKSSSCNIKEAFNDQKIVLNIDFCGSTAGIPDIWNPQCGTKASTCKGYVASTPDAFNDVFWKVQSINIFQLGVPASTTTTTSTTTTSTSTSSTSTTTTTTESSTTTSSTSTSESSTSTSSSSTESSTTSTESSTTSSDTSTTSSESTSTTSSDSASSTESSTSSTETSTSSTETSTSSTETSTSPTESATSTSSETSGTDTSTETSTTQTAVTETSTATSTDPATNTDVSTTAGSSSTSIPLTTGPVTTATSGSTTSAPYGNSTSSLPPYGNSTSSLPPYGNSTATQTGGSGTGGSGSATATSTGSGSGSGSGSSSSLPTDSTTSYTTSTIVTTSVHTITSCPPTVTNCPLGQVTTEIITIGTTICPVTETSKPAGPTSTPGGSGSGSSPLPSGYTTSTVYTTKTYTITSCAPTVTNCPAQIGKVTTETVALYTTVCPIGSIPTAPGGGNVKFTTKYTTLQATTTTTKAPVVDVTATVVPKPSGSSPAGGAAGGKGGKGSGAGSGAPYPGKNSTTSAAQPYGSAAPSGKAPLPTTGGGKSVVVSGGVQAGASLVMVLLGAAAVFAL